MLRAYEHVCYMSMTFWGTTLTHFRLPGVSTKTIGNAVKEPEAEQ
jgi:hypothetical protein